MPRYLWILLALLSIFAWRQWSQREIVHPPGQLSPRPPIQQALTPDSPLTLGEFELQPRAAFQVHARVLSTRRYRWGREADLAPVDLALGWGPMSDQAVLDRMDISQGNRWYFTHYTLPAPLPDGAIIRNSSNMHMVPAEPWIHDELLDLRPGDVVRLEGFLVDARDSAGFTWTTSLSREDTGNGACELFYVSAFSRAPRP
ncbi:hypothetical protein [Elongatibacter sediminis]|uniref:Uncharacterized protein n=1 Tax=Elongatibacter sediminis TaxID=3119006 RepID=A0AAW9R9F0_9GAMM